MADKTDDLVISVSTDTSTVKRQLRQLGQDITATTKGVQKQFETVGKGIDKSMSSALQVRINEMVGIGTRGAKEWQGALADQGKEFERLRMKMNPIFATVKNYKASIAEIQTAHRIGAISADEMAAAIGRERTAALASIAAIKQRNAALADTPAVRGNFNTFNSANIAAQFQDIGVTAAMGMNPLMIALQQGTQLSAVLNTMGGYKDVIRGLGAAFASIINPISLVTIGVIAATTAAAQYFLTSEDGTDATAKALKEQADLIQRVADKWGDALPAIKAYADEQKRLADQKDVGEATATRVRDIWAPVKESVEDARLSIADVQLQIQNLADVNSVAELNDAFQALRDRVKDGSAEAEDLERVAASLAALFEQTNIPIVSDLAAEFGALAAQTKAASDNAATFQQQKASLDLESNFKKNLPESDLGRLDPLGEMDANRDQTNRADATKSQYQLELERAAKRRGARTKAPPPTADDRFFEDIEAIRQRTRALAEEQAMIGMTFEAQTKRRTAFELEQKALKQVREEARKKGDQDWQNAQLTPDQVAKINEVSEAYAKQAESLRVVQEAQAEFEDWMNLGRSATRGFIDDLLNGATAGEAFANVLGKIGDKLLDMAMNDLWGSGGGGGLLSMLFGGFGGGGGFSPNTSLAAMQAARTSTLAAWQSWARRDRSF
jgi:hypothetical protein